VVDKVVEEPELNADNVTEFRATNSEDKVENVVLFKFDAEVLGLEIELLIAEVIFKLLLIDELCVNELLLGLLEAEAWVEILAVVGLVEILEVDREVLVVPGVEVVEVLEFEEEVLEVDVEVEPLGVEVELLVVIVELLIAEV